jgi:hypothetical protein
MAERISDIEPHRGRPAIYPWEEWLDGSSWRITRGADFDISPVSMAAIIRQRAERAGLTATCRREGDDAIVFKASATPDRDAA